MFIINLKIAIIALFCFSGIVIARAQDFQSVDSLKTILKNTKKQTVIVDLLNRIASEYWKYSIKEYKDSLKSCINQAIDIARKINYKTGLAIALFNQGKYHITTNDYARSTPALLESLELYENLRDNDGISKCYLQLGLTSYVLQNYEEAIRNFNLSISFRDNSTATYLMALSYSEIDSFPLAGKYLRQVIDEFKADDDQSMLTSSYMYFGYTFNKQGNIDSALFYLNLAIQRAKKISNRKFLSRPYAFISQVYLKAKKLNEAIYYAEQSYEITKSNYDIISVIEASNTLRQAYQMKGNFKKAFFFLDLLNNTKEEYFTSSTMQKVAEMQSAFEFKKKWHIDSLNLAKEKLKSELAYKETIHIKNNERNISIAIGLAIVIIAAGLFSRLKYIREAAAIIQHEKHRSDELLLNILPHEVAEELKAKGTAEAKQFDNVTVMFTDFVNFTQAVENMTPQELIDELHECFKEFDRIMQKYNIEKIKTSGDSYLAVCGLPLANPEHAENVVNAAIEINDFMIERMKSKSEHNFHMRIGINSGSVIAGIVGVTKFAYDIWGDTVNIAARMEQNSEPGKINISGSTYELIKDKFTFVPRGKIDAKNMGMINMYFVNK